MRVIGVIDLAAGRAVHARGGRRTDYAPVRLSGAAAAHVGDPCALARTYLETRGLTELYVADLDAIGGGPSQDAAIGALIRLGAPLWLDSGVHSVPRARHALGLGASFVVVGLETLPSYDVLSEICADVGSERVAFSLDLRDGLPITAHADVAAGRSVEQIAARAVEAGVGAIIVIDVARVGMGEGVDLALISSLRSVAPAVLLAGGGVRGSEDLASLAHAGCDGVLVATALHDGRIGAAEVAAAARPG
uniref:Orf17 n=1 Tax=uncultured bacterium BAC10-10 TaxID=333372 RepID=Q4JIN2_9BACT|nr:Orf17 [uncultured bacterium BAC10-10]